MSFDSTPRYPTSDQILAQERNPSSAMNAITNAASMAASANSLPPLPPSSSSYRGSPNPNWRSPSPPHGFYYPQPNSYVYSNLYNIHHQHGPPQDEVNGCPPPMASGVPAYDMQSSGSSTGSVAGPGLQSAPWRPDTVRRYPPYGYHGVPIQQQPYSQPMAANPAGRVSPPYSKSIYPTPPEDYRQTELPQRVTVTPPMDAHSEPAVPLAPASNGGQFVMARDYEGMVGIRRVVEGRTFREYPCSMCGKTFSRPSSLSQHIRSHTGERPFVCVVGSCPLAFTTQSNLKRHLRKHEERGQL